MRSASVLCSVLYTLRVHWVCQCGLYNTMHKVPTSYLETSIHRMVHRAFARSSIQNAQSAINLGAVNKRQHPIDACDIIGNLSFKQTTSSRSAQVTSPARTRGVAVILI